MKMRLYLVSSIDYAYDSSEGLALFSSEEEANSFIEDCKKRFYIEGDNVIIHDYRDLTFSISEWDVDEFKNRTITD